MYTKGTRAPFAQIKSGNYFCMLLQKLLIRGRAITELQSTEDVSYLDVTKCHGLYRMSGRDSNVTLYSIELLYKRSHSHYMYNIVVKTSMRALTEEKSCIQYLQIYTNFSSALLEVSGCKNNNKPCSFIENNITKTDPLC